VPAWRRLSGRDTVEVRALEAWSPSDSLRLAVLDGRTRLIATHVSALDSSYAVALVPVAPMLAGRIARVVGVRLRLETDFASLPEARARTDSLVESVVNPADPGAATDHVPARATTGSGAPAGSRARWVITPRPGHGAPVEAATPRSGLFNGRAAVAALVWTHDHWAARFALIAAENDAHRIFLGLYRDVRENPFAIVPLAALAFVFSVFVFVLIFDFRMVRELGGSVAGAVATLRAGTAALERGDLSHRIEVRGRDDLWEVAEAFNRMAAGLERGRELEAERRRVEEELALARRIQTRLLPGAPPSVPGLEIAGVSESAREVGGDYYDHFLMTDGRVALTVADVSGKGVPAALLMSAVRAALITQPVEAESPADVLCRIHRLVFRSVEPGRFVTAFLAFLDPRTGHLEYCNAGHNPPILMHEGGALERLERGGLVLGILEDARFETGELVVPPGALLALFSDGIPEAQDPAGQLWDEEPLIALLRASSGVPLTTLAGRVVESVRAFEAGRAPSDDVTLLLARRA
jgi:serine phosphatase RsbU (regulator of sigma subunit)